MAKENTLAEECTKIALRQLRECWTFKQPRIRAIQSYRRLYNTQVLPKLRVQFNVPLPVFSGMIDTLQADLDDGLMLKFESGDPADWKAIQKVNAAIKQESDSMRPGAKWNEKWRDARLEAIFSGRGILKFSAGNEEGYHAELEVVPFEDFFFEPSGGGDLENHLYAGQQNIWRTKKQLEDGAASGLYDKAQVKKLTVDGTGKDYKMNGVWDSSTDMGNRFRSLGLSNVAHNYVGEEMYHLCEWVMTYQGTRWQLVFEAYTGIWLSFKKRIEACSADTLPWISFASHKDLRNFASKSFADDLYPVADSIITLFNQDLTNRQKRNLNARAYDKDMFKDVAKLDEAQYRPDALVPVDTKNGSHRISEGIYAFETPAIAGTVDLISWLMTNTGQKVGITDTQQGAPDLKGSTIPVVNASVSQIGKRLSFASQPFITAGQQLGNLFFASLKDYMSEPMAVKLLGETGFEWDVLKRIDLSLKRDFEISVISRTASNQETMIETDSKSKALTLLATPPVQNQGISIKAWNEYVLRDLGGFTEYETAIFLDNTNQANKESASMLSAAIQEIGLRGKMPLPNYNADLFFLHGLLKFARKMRGTLPEKKFNLLMQYIDTTQTLVQQNADAGMPMSPVGLSSQMPQSQQTQQGAPSPVPNAPIPVK